MSFFNSGAMFDSLWGTLNDPFKDGPEGLIREHKAATRTELGKVVKYYPERNTALVNLFSAGDGVPSEFPVSIQYQGKLPGTGHVYALNPNQLVQVVFAGGITGTTNNQGIIVGTVATDKDHWAARHPMWLQAKNKPGRMVIDTKGDTEGNIELVDAESNTFRVTTNNVDAEVYGSENTTYSGVLQTFSEKATEESASLFGSAADMIKV